MTNRCLKVAFAITLVFAQIPTFPSSVKAHDFLNLPAPGIRVNLTAAYTPALLKGLVIHKDDPLLFDFIVDVGQDKLRGKALKDESEKLIKYFLASLAISPKDLWVNLSPYEKDRIIPSALGQTDMGRDLLAQDYILKQITASLIYPEKSLGKVFWDRVYARARQLYGNTQVPINTFNKVWIMADKAEVYEHNQTVLVVKSHLKVMLEEDYLALTKNNHSFPLVGRARERGNDRNTFASTIVRALILPELEKEVNTGKNFATLRQITNSLILASWYKNNLKEALLNQVYADKEKTKGINLKDPRIKELIYERYLQAYKKGVFNYVKEETTDFQGQTIPRKYFAGGWNAAMASHPDTVNDFTQSSENEDADSLVRVKTQFVFKTPEKALAVTAIATATLIAVWSIMDLWGHRQVMAELEALKSLPSSGSSFLQKIAVKAADVKGIRVLGEKVDNGTGVLYIQDMQGPINLRGMERDLGIWRIEGLSVQTVNPGALEGWEKVRERPWGWGTDIELPKDTVVKFTLPGDLAMLSQPSEMELKITDELNSILKVSGVAGLVGELQARGLKLVKEEEGRVSFFYTKEGKRQLRQVRSFFIKDGEFKKSYSDYRATEQFFIIPIFAAEVKPEAVCLINTRLSLPHGLMDRLRRPVAAQHAVFPTEVKGAGPTQTLTKAAGPSDRAMSGRPKDGGIDLNEANISWDIHKQGPGIEMAIHPAIIERIKKNGVGNLTPEIESITPIKSALILIS